MICVVGIKFINKDLIITLKDESQVEIVYDGNGIQYLENITTIGSKLRVANNTACVCAQNCGIEQGKTITDIVISSGIIIVSTAAFQSWVLQMRRPIRTVATRFTIESSHGLKR